MITITRHAVERWQERVSPLTPKAIRAAIRASTPVIEIAAAFGCDCVVRGDGVRLKLKGTTVATVLEKRGR